MFVIVKDSPNYSDNQSRIMKKLLPFLVLLILVSCETPSLELTVESPEIPVYQAPEESDVIETEGVIIENPIIEDIELIFETKENPFAEIVMLDDRCSFESYLEENSSDIIIAEVTKVDSMLSRLQVLEWQKGQPQESTEQIIFKNDISTAPDFSKDGIYKIYLSNIDGTYQVTCHYEGVVELDL